MVAPKIMLLQIFAAWPAPLAPAWITALPMALRIGSARAKASSLPPTMKVNKSGKTVELAPWLISVNGVPLTTPKNLSRVSHEFLGNVTLGIQFVPVNLPPSLGSGQYSGPLILTFTD